MESFETQIKKFGFDNTEKQEVMVISWTVRLHDEINWRTLF